MSSKPEPAEPEVNAYTWTYDGYPEVVLCFERPVDPNRVKEALSRSMARSRMKGELTPTVFFRGNHVALVDARGSHTPNRLRVRGLKVAAYLGYSAKFVAPPSR